MTKSTTEEAVAFDDLPWIPPSPSLSSRTLSRRSRMSARVTIVTPDGRQVHAESHTEALAYYALQQHPDVQAVFEQPDGVRYLDHQGAERFHTFDFVAVLRDGTRVAVIVKPRAVAERRDTAGLARLIASQIPRSVADKVVLLMEEHVGGDRAHDARLLHATRLFPAPEDDRLVMEHATRANGPVSVASLCSATGLDGRAYRSVARLVGEGRLLRTDGGRLTLESLVMTVGEGA